MPFTLTHILATLPVARAWAPPGTFAALVIGSMVPDWPLYLPIGPAFDVVHPFTGGFVYSLMSGLAITLLFLSFMKRPLYELLPAGLRQRTARYLDKPEKYDAKTILQLALAVCVGSITHIVWDAFTHGNAWGVAMFPHLKQVWISVAGVKFPGYLVIQHGSSLIGLPMLIGIFFLWYLKIQPDHEHELLVSRPARMVWLGLIVVVPFLLMLKYAISLENLALRPLVNALYYGMKEAGLALLVLTASYSLLFYPWVRWRKK